MSKLDLSKFLYSPPPADPLEGQRAKTVEYLNDALNALDAGKPFDKIFKDKGDFYEVKIRTAGNKVIRSYNVRKEAMRDFLDTAVNAVEAKQADDWFGDDVQVNKIGIPTGRTRTPRTPEQKAAASEAAKKRWAKKRAEDEAAAKKK